MTSTHQQPGLVLYQALAPGQLAALVRTDWRCIEPGRGGERFLYLKLNQRYAEMIARQRHVRRHGAGYVASLSLPASALADHALETVAYQEHLEYRVPVTELGRLNSQLLRPLQLVAAFRHWESYSIPPGKPVPAALLAQRP